MDAHVKSVQERLRQAMAAPVDQLPARGEAPAVSGVPRPAPGEAAENMDRIMARFAATFAPTRARSGK